MKNRLISLVVISLFSYGIAFAEDVKKESPWEEFKFLIGTWEGVVDGDPGKGTSERSYEFVLGGNFIQVKNTSTYPAQEKNPKGETHEDWGFISFDKNRKLFVLRQFHIESFATQYKMEERPDTKTITFVSESIENIRPGWRARETYKINNEDEFTETFELAPPNQDFAIYSKTSYKRNSP